MNNFLGEIIELKKKRLTIAREKISLEDLKRKAFAVRENSDSHRLQIALTRNDKINIIAEIKRASPSKGVINDKINVAEVAKNYEMGGACAISVLTEEDKFQGSLEDLKTAKSAVEIPVLRKDFIFDEFQIYEAAG
ncbi:MAG: indole-3-glycerol-phosphate synthase TrpC, partial [Acidobacteria bacterium]|nr:indole-3-glycerol-phosphate synthase TrpC [Acidobacteriota bacterium]